MLQPTLARNVARAGCTPLHRVGYGGNELVRVGLVHTMLLAVHVGAIIGGRRAYDGTQFAYLNVMVQRARCGLIADVREQLPRTKVLKGSCVRRHFRRGGNEGGVGVWDVQVGSGLT